jgi:predicted amidophosphoribosyltransferase
MKYEKIEPLGTWFAKRLDESVLADAEWLEADIVVPVPLHRQREKERGYKQVDLFAKSLARRLGLPYRPVLLKRAKPRPFAAAGGALGSGTWRFCHGKRRSS